MAIIYDAELRPSKAEVLQALLDGEPWGGAGALELIGAYRFDDPAGEVGVECHLLRRGDRVLHVPLTYRDAPLPDETHLVGRLQHSVLGERFVHDATGDPVALACFAAALHGARQAAVWEQHAAPDESGRSRPVGEIEPGVELTRADGELVREPPLTEGAVVLTLADGEELHLARVLGGPGLTGAARREPGLTGATVLRASWSDGSAVVAALG